MSSICYLRKKTTLGWGFLTAWGLIGMSLHATYAQSPSYEVAVIGSLANTCSFFAIALIAVLSSKRKQDTLSRSSGQYKKRLLISSFTVALVMTLVGSIFPLVPQMLFFQAGAVALAVASIGYAIMTIAWGVFYAQLDVQKIEQDSIYSTLVCALSYLVAIVLPHNASVLFRMLLPVLSFACYLSVLQNEPETKDGHSAQNELTPNRPASEVFPLSRAFSLIIFAIALSSTVLSSPAHLATMSSFFVIPQYVKLMPVATLSGLIMAVLLVIYCIVFARRINLSAFFHILCPLATLGLFLIVIPSAPLALIGYGLLLAAQWMLYLFVWIHAAELSNRSKINPVLALASLRFAFDLGFLISSALFPLFDKQEIPDRLHCTWP